MHGGDKKLKAHNDQNGSRDAEKLRQVHMQASLYETDPQEDRQPQADQASGEIQNRRRLKRDG